MCFSSCVSQHAKKGLRGPTGTRGATRLEMANTPALRPQNQRECFHFGTVRHRFSRPHRARNLPTHDSRLYSTRVAATNAVDGDVAPAHVARCLRTNNREWKLQSRNSRCIAARHARFSDVVISGRCLPRCMRPLWPMQLRQPKHCSVSGLLVVSRVQFVCAARHGVPSESLPIWPSWLS